MWWWAVLVEGVEDERERGVGCAGDEWGWQYGGRYGVRHLVQL
jgi:hypothetical protein